MCPVKVLVVYFIMCTYPLCFAGESTACPYKFPFESTNISSSDGRRTGENDITKPRGSTCDEPRKLKLLHTSTTVYTCYNYCSSNNYVLVLWCKAGTVKIISSSLHLKSITHFLVLHVYLVGLCTACPYKLPFKPTNVFSSDGSGAGENDITSPRGNTCDELCKLKYIN